LTYRVPVPWGRFMTTQGQRGESSPLARTRLSPDCPRGPIQRTDPERRKVGMRRMKFCNFGAFFSRGFSQRRPAEGARRAPRSATSVLGASGAVHVPGALRPSTVSTYSVTEFARNPRPVGMSRRDGGTRSRRVPAGGCSERATSRASGSDSPAPSDKQKRWVRSEDPANPAGVAWARLALGRHDGGDLRDDLGSCHCHADRDGSG